MWCFIGRHVYFSSYWKSGGRRNRAFRHNLGDEDNSSSIIVALFATNIEAQVDFIEIGMKRHWEISE